MELAEYLQYTNTDRELEDWDTILALSEMRLASLLCLEAIPTDSEGNMPEDFKLLLANFIYIMTNEMGAGSEKVASKSVRNFTISFQSTDASKPFGKLSTLYGDIIAKYSKCGVSFKVERGWRPSDDLF